MLKRLGLALLATTFLMIGVPAFAAPANISYTVGVCNPSYPQRCVAVAADGSVPVTSTPSGTADVNLKQVNGAAVNVGAGAAGTGTQRVTTSTDSTIGTVAAVTSITNALPAGSNIIGNVRIDQTTPGTTNGVQVNAALPVGTNSIGVVQGNQTHGAAVGSTGFQPMLYNHTTGVANRAWSVQADMNAAQSGQTYAGLGGQCDDVSIAALTENNFGQARISCTDHGLLVHEMGNSFTNITTNTDTVIKASAGTLYGLIINTVGTTSTATIYNNTTCTGAKIGTFSTVTQTALSALNISASVGICITTAGAGAADITATWR